jgi:DNA-binding NarL/FixJ family response regulator
MIKVLIIDDHPIVREGLQGLGVHNEIEICGEADNSREAIELSEKMSPDIIIMDVFLKESDGISLSEMILTRNNGIKIIIFSAACDIFNVERAVKRNLHGYISKEYGISMIIDAIQCVMKGEKYYSPDIREIITKIESKLDSERNGFYSISDREKEVFFKLIYGFPPKMISSDLQITDKTVYAHIENIKRKLGSDNSIELYQLAVRLGLIPPP